MIFYIGKTTSLYWIRAQCPKWVFMRLNTSTFLAMLPHNCIGDQELIWQSQIQWNLNFVLIDIFAHPNKIRCWRDMLCSICSVHLLARYAIIAKQFSVILTKKTHTSKKWALDHAWFRSSGIGVNRYQVIAYYNLTSFKPLSHLSGQALRASYGGQFCCPQFPAESTHLTVFHTVLTRTCPQVCTQVRFAHRQVLSMLKTLSE